MLKAIDALQKRKCRLSTPNIKLKTRALFGVLGETFWNLVLTGIHSMQGWGMTTKHGVTN